MTKFAYFEGAIRPIEEAKVSVMTHAFNYGTGWFGGLRGYWNAEQEQLYVFRIRDHYLRFLDSGKILMANVDETVDDLIRATVDLLQREGYREDCYIRPLGYKADAMIGVRLHNLHDRITIFTTPFGRYIEDEEGARVCVSSWRRVDDTALPPRGKIVGSYVNSALIKSEAVLNGFDEALVLNHDGHVAEGSAENFFIVRGDSLITPPIHANVLEGITRRTIVELARRELGLNVVEREIDRSEVYVADEAFFCGTGVQVVAIASVDHRPIGSGKMGQITNRLRDLYFRVVRGQEPKYAHWLTPVHQSEAVTA
ncbi:MAG: branched-chain amino acid transaminase [Caldilinea sp.]|nr:branched-chain amino acid transaminase [Caldilineaceae bacterium]MCO5213277.1 branched-chain amino acid transaminase [Caldilinea sp.]MCW5840761.1 branched-chain amino acid transaminase [Caldilinea sp.]